jgi:hypothetical protein
MTALELNLTKTKLSGRQKCLLVSLLCLQVPSTIVFIPVAAVLVLTGIFAPLGMMSFALGTKPFSQAMKLKNKWQSQQDLNISPEPRVRASVPR